MSRIVELPDVVYSALEKAAQAKGMTPAAWIAERLAAPVSPPPNVAEPTQNAGTLADVLAARIGKIHSGSKEGLSENTGKHFTDDLEIKRREGVL